MTCGWSGTLRSDAAFFHRARLRPHVQVRDAVLTPDILPPKLTNLRHASARLGAKEGTHRWTPVARYSGGLQDGRSLALLEAEHRLARLLPAPHETPAAGFVGSKSLSTADRKLALNAASLLSLIVLGLLPSSTRCCFHLTMSERWTDSASSRPTYPINLVTYDHQRSSVDLAGLLSLAHPSSRKVCSTQPDAGSAGPCPTRGSALTISSGP